MRKNKSMKIAFLMLLLMPLSVMARNVLDLNESWKFKTGDNIQWASPDWNDHDWKTINVSKNWEKQGYENYNGYAWYRIKINIPASLQDHSYLKDSLLFILGMIDDCDQFYLNGVLIGENNHVCKKTEESGPFEKNGSYNTIRRYILPVTNPNILWGKENSLAIRVYDHSGEGGLFESKLCVKMLDIDDFCTLKASDNSSTKKASGSDKTYTIQNPLSFTLYGNITVIAKNQESGEVLQKKDFPVKLNPGESQSVDVTFPSENEPVSVFVTFKHRDSENTLELNEELPYILTPATQTKPRINGPAISGVRPGSPYLYYVPITGEKPITCLVKGLPKGLVFDPCTQIISGKVEKAGSYHLSIQAKNNYGQTKRTFLLKVGDEIALTPPMGWNSWNCWGLSVDQDKVIASAKVFKEKGLMDHGWAYINIDDAWEAGRSEKGDILPNSKFPNMKALGDSLHAMGLRFGIYSSPGPLTCGGYAGSYQHEMSDATTYANWGIDYLKYDWCSYGQISKGETLQELQKPYILMSNALKSQNRDIVHSLCQYGMGKVWEWGKEVGGQLWRTTGDITDTWNSMSSIGFNQIENAAFAKPGSWNDPDMLTIGWVGWGPELHQTRLTINEQYTHISLWSLLSAPLLIGCDLTKMDDFTLNLLTNDEVIGINQDPLGKQASPVSNDGTIQIWVKNLEDGSKAVGIFNLSESTQSVKVNMKDLGLKGKQTVRDVWKQKELGKVSSTFETHVGRHGVKLVRFIK